MWFLFTGPSASNCAFVQTLLTLRLILHGLLWGLSTKRQDASCPRCGSSTWKQGARVDCSCKKYNLHLFPSDCAESKSYHPSAPPEQHWLMAVPRYAQVWQRELGKVTLEGKRHGKPSICHSHMKLQASCPRQRGRNKWKAKHICNYRGI